MSNVNWILMFRHMTMRWVYQNLMQYLFCRIFQPSSAIDWSQDVEHLCYNSATTCITVQKWETKERGKTKLVGFKRVQLFKTGNKPEWVTAAPDVACGLSTLRAPLVGSENNLCTFGAANVPLHSWLSFSCSIVMRSMNVEPLQKWISLLIPFIP